MLQSKWNNNLWNAKIWVALALAAFSLWLAMPAAQAALPPLPTLPWQQRSDWINIKSNGKLSAFGDGVHDDTAAIQAGLNTIAVGYFGRKTLYLPGGVYRISRTLVLSNVLGTSLIGQGRNTRIVWAGGTGQSMLVSNGADYGRFVGIIWDGAGKASVGVDHQPKSVYEESNRHEDESFVNFTVAGIRVGYNYILPSSEMTFHNCSFQNCVAGIAFLSDNDYNNNIDGCEFQDNGTAISVPHGNVYVRDCHFERSRVVDVFLGSHVHSIRRCTSVGSKQFILAPVSGAGCGVTVQDCHVDGWTGSQGAMTFGMRGPTTIFDSSFTTPPDAKAPVRLTNSINAAQVVIASNNSASASPAVFDPGQNAQIITLPVGLRGASLSDPHQSFFKSSETVPGAVLDVKQTFGAKGDGVHDDTSALQSALAAAQTAGAGTVVYLPPGNYIVSGTLPITGGSYTVEGSGHQSAITWTGPTNGVIWSVRDPQSVALKNMSFFLPPTAAVIRQTSAGTGSSTMLYQRLWFAATLLGPGDSMGAYGHITHAQNYRGLECDSLPSGSAVLLDDVTGMTHFTNCSRAVILGNFVLGVVQVDGALYDKTGFLGMLSHNACGNICDVVVHDNQDFVGTNFYTEQTQDALQVSGDGATSGLPGHVTIQGSRTATYDSTPIMVNNYAGRVTYAEAGLECPLGPKILHKGTQPVDIALLGNVGVGGKPTFTLGTGAQLTLLQNYVFAGASQTVLPNALPDTGSAAVALVSGTSAGILEMTGLAGPIMYGPLATYTQIGQPQFVSAVAALDDFRLLGATDLALNYPSVAAG